MHSSNFPHSDRSITTFLGSIRLGAIFMGVALSAGIAAFSPIANATNYNENTQGDLSNSSSAPTNIGALSADDNFIAGASVPSGSPIPGGHGALTNQDNDFFTFTVPKGTVLSQFDLVGDSKIASGDRFFLGIYAGSTSPADPGNPSPAGLLGYTLPGVPQIGTDLLPALAASNEPGFPPLQDHFSGSLGAGEYTVWVVDGDNPLHYDVDLKVASVPEPATLGLFGIGFAGLLVRRHRRT